MSTLEKSRFAGSPPQTPISPARHDGGEEPRDFRERPLHEDLEREAGDVALANMGVIAPRRSYIGLLVAQFAPPTRGSVRVDTSAIEYSSN